VLLSKAMSRSTLLFGHVMPKKYASALYVTTLVTSLVVGCTPTAQHLSVAEERVGQLLSASLDAEAKLNVLEFSSREGLASELHFAVRRDPRTHASLAEIVASEAEIESAASTRLNVKVTYCGG